VKACLDDAVAAIKLVQAKAAEWNIDPTRIGLTGGSAGACSSLYASLQGDNALGIRAVLAHSPQTSLDPQETKEWIPNARYGAHAFGYGSFDNWLAHRADCLPLIERYSPAALLRACTPTRAPTFLYTCGALPPPGQLPADPTHAAMFCIKFEELCTAKGVACRRGTFDELIKELAK
jgi:acetyl esterase/lipase